MEKMKLGILGAGKLGIALARLGIAAGYEVAMIGTKPPEKIGFIMEILAPKVKVIEAKKLIAESDVIFLALPLGKYQTLNPEWLKGKIVIDAMNYWWEVDGLENTISSIEKSSSEVVADYLKDSLVVKAFNHMGYHDLEIESNRNPADKKIIAFATDEKNTIPVVEKIIADFGFESLFLGPLKKGLLLEPGSPLFGANLDHHDFMAILDGIYETEFGQEIIKKRGKI